MKVSACDGGGGVEGGGKDANSDESICFFCFFEAGSGSTASIMSEFQSTAGSGRNFRNDSGLHIL